jgi:hypothetical protein
MPWRLKAYSDYHGWSFFHVGAELFRSPAQFSSGKGSEWSLYLYLGAWRWNVRLTNRYSREDLRKLRALAPVMVWDPETGKYKRKEMYTQHLLQTYVPDGYYLERQESVIIQHKRTGHRFVWRENRWVHLAACRCWKRKGQT